MLVLRGDDVCWVSWVDGILIAIEFSSGGRREDTGLESDSESIRVVRYCRADAELRRCYLLARAPPVVMPKSLLAVQEHE